MDCFDEILCYYNEKNRTVLSTHLWCTQYLIKLTGARSGDMTTSKIENCIILLLNLFIFEVPDRFHSLGKSIKELDNSDKGEVITILKSEFDSF